MSPQVTLHLRQLAHCFRLNTKANQVLKGDGNHVSCTLRNCWCCWCDWGIICRWSTSISGTWPVVHIQRTYSSIANYCSTLSSICIITRTATKGGGFGIQFLDKQVSPTRSLSAKASINLRE